MWASNSPPFTLKLRGSFRWYLVLVVALSAASMSCLDSLLYNSLVQLHCTKIPLFGEIVKSAANCNLSIRLIVLDNNDKKRGDRQCIVV